MPELANLWVGVGADISDFNRKMQRVGAKTRDVGKKMTRAGTSMTKGVTLPVAAAGAGVVAMAADFQGAMNSVQAVTQPTTKQMAAMEKQAKELGRTTQFSASEAAEGMKFLGQAGLTAAQQMQALPDMLDLAAAGSLELGRASDIATDLMASFGLGVEDVQRVGDVLAETASSATTDINMVAQAMSQVAPVAKSSGISLEETSAALGVLASSGIKASKAGTQLRATIAKMEAPSKAQKRAMDALGVSFTDAQGDTVGLIEAVNRMKQAGADTGDIMEIFGRRAGSAMAALVQQGAPAIREFESELENAQGRMSEMAETKMQGLPGQLRRLKSAFEGMALAIADSGVVSMFMRIAEKVRSVMQAIAEANPTVLKVGVIIAGLAAAIGPVVVAIGAMTAAVGAIAAAMTPVVAVIAGVVAGIAALAAGLVVAYQKSETFRSIVQSVWAGVKSAISTAVTVARKVIAKFVSWGRAIWNRWGSDVRKITGMLTSFITKHIKSAITFVRGIIEYQLGFIRRFWQQWGDEIMAFLSRWGGTISSFFSELWNNIKTVLSGVLDVMVGIIKTTLAVMQGDWSTAWDGIKQVFSGVWQIIKGTLGQVLNTMKAMVSTMLNAVGLTWREGWNSVKSTLSSAWDSMTSAVSTGIDETVQFFADLPGRIVSALGDLGGLLLDAGKDLVGGLVDGIKGAAGNIGSAISDAVSAGVSALNPFGDGPGFGMPSGSGGDAMARAQRAMQGLPVSVTSSYRTPAENAAAGGSPTSYHMDRSNPAVDIGGPTWALDVVAARLRQMDNREMLWRTAGHFDHVHVADSGATLAPGLNLLRNNTGGAEPLQPSADLLPTMEHIADALDQIPNALDQVSRGMSTGLKPLPGGDVGRFETTEGVKGLQERWENIREAVFDSYDTTRKIADLERRMADATRWSDEWVRLRDRRLSLIDQERSEMRSLMDERKKMEKEVAQARRQHMQQVDEAIASRREELAGQVDPLAGVSRITDAGSRTHMEGLFRAGDAIDSVREQTRMLGKWGEAVSRLRGKGFDQSMLERLGLAKPGGQALSQARQLLGSDRLGGLRKAFDRLDAQIGQQVERESTGDTPLGREIRGMRADFMRSQAEQVRETVSVRREIAEQTQRLEQAISERPTRGEMRDAVRAG